MNVLLVFIMLDNVLAGIICIRFSAQSPIVNGFNKPIEPKEDEFPYQATLLAQVNGTRLIFCGGSLIHPRWILTAAHCLEQDGKQFPPDLVKISLGSVYYDLRGGQILNVEKIIIHRAYFNAEKNHDIGLLKLIKSVKLSRNVDLVNLHTNDSENLLGRTAYLTGLGIVNDFFRRPNRLRKATLHISTPEKCLIDPDDDVGQICSTSKIYEGKACKGDSGGPLVIKRSGKLYQIGITSHLSTILFTLR